MDGVRPMEVDASQRLAYQIYLEVDDILLVADELRGRRSVSLRFHYLPIFQCVNGLPLFFRPALFSVRLLFPLFQTQSCNWRCSFVLYAIYRKQFLEQQTQSNSQKDANRAT